MIYLILLILSQVCYNKLKFIKNIFNKIQIFFIWIFQYVYHSWKFNEWRYLILLFKIYSLFIMFILILPFEIIIIKNHLTCILCLEFFIVSFLCFWHLDFLFSKKMLIIVILGHGTLYSTYYANRILPFILKFWSIFNRKNLILDMFSWMLKYLVHLINCIFLAFTMITAYLVHQFISGKIISFFDLSSFIF